MLEDLQRKRYHVAILSWTSLFQGSSERQFLSSIGEKLTQ